MANPQTDPTDGTLRPVRRRRAELTLLLASIGVTAAALLFASVSVTDGIDSRAVVYTLTLGAGALGLHVLLRFVAPYADPVLLPVATALSGLGTTMIWALQMTRDNDPGNGEADRQLLWTMIGMGLCAATVLFVRHPRRLTMYTYLIALCALVLLLLPLSPLGHEVLGARRWIMVGPFTMQPSEFAKVLLVVFLASYLGRQRDVMALVTRTFRIGGVKVFSAPRARDLAPMAVGWGIAVLLLVGTKDLGTSLLLFGTFLAVLYAATARKSWVLIGLLAFSAAAYVAYLLFGHVQNRVRIWLDAFDPEVYHSDGGSFQVVEGLIALAYGGLLGTGFHDGEIQNLFAADSDLILVSVGEKLGLTGLLAVLVLLFLFAQRALRIALGCRDVFLKLTAFGYGFITAFNVFIVLGGATLIIPLTGMTTPFLSAGGSALMANWLIVGLLLTISETARRPQESFSAGLAPSDPSTEVINVSDLPESVRDRRQSPPAP
ncbi:cell division protein FtsW [Nocardiopsis terrae]|uniref:Cell division protein FtsW (Lipid II flippase) n=1 Tax=Nocardiopsis terrae TaxID=372655 RepID=A0ABR9HM35_9ACTN|nr:FtsW/RodA/SpoVE family cell cycle protein [Nocardiopsis terrae]MBE1460031.1 cell division protein FtsW (lipid II flippase) [Nocardiopsis terrae]GHC92823.1 cell division protein FtsW [Nocardiopsis terrae]